MPHKPILQIMLQESVLGVVLNYGGDDDENNGQCFTKILNIFASQNKFFLWNDTISQMRYT